jgi:hypothetical protein
MKLANSSNIFRLSLLYSILTIVFLPETISQQRKDEEMPMIVSTVKSIANLKGWAKDDIGKWREFNTAFNSLESRYQILKIELAKINYEGTEYLCVAGFTKGFYIKYNVKQIQYNAFFWLIDSTKQQDLPGTDTTVHTRLFQNFIVSSIVGNFKAVTWNDILIQMKKCFIGTYPNSYDTSFQARREERKHYNLPTLPHIDPSFDPYESFFIKYRYVNNKTQFYMGTLDYRYLSEEGEISFKDAFLLLDCYDKDENRNLNCRYFEVSKSMFDNFFKSIIK